MAMEARQIEAMVREAFPDARVMIEALKNDGDHYAMYVETSAFAGKTRVQQHQMVYAALRGKVGGDLHALSLTTKALSSGH